MLPVVPVVLQAFSGVRTVPDFLVQLEQFGLLDAVLPFILIFAVVFTVIRTTKVLGDKKGIHTLVAIVMALLVVVPHVLGTYPPGQDVVNIINTALPNVSLVIVIIVAALILVGIFRPNKEGVPMGGFFAFLSVGAIIYIFGLSAGWWETFGGLSFLSNPDIQALLVIVLVFALVIFMITADNPLEDAGAAWRRLTGGR
ncbi:hypothetical protein HYV83_04870 [Candidatus Woesearchaeota archaeon]|nr:hypothetical protein [Candidatus Woesearchaeota archaeon]